MSNREIKVGDKIRIRATSEADYHFFAKGTICTVIEPPTEFSIFEDMISVEIMFTERGYLHVEGESKNGIGLIKQIIEPGDYELIPRETE